MMYGALFLVSPRDKTGRHLRILGELSSRADDPRFLEKWLSAATSHEIREIFLRADQFVMISIHRDGSGSDLIGLQLDHLRLPAGSMAGTIYRNGEPLYPWPDDVFQEPDRLIIVGDPKAIRRIQDRYHPNKKRF